MNEFEQTDENAHLLRSPLTNESATYLWPKLLLMAKGYLRKGWKSSNCESSAEDLVQEAMLVMSDTKRRWTNAFIVARSAMASSLNSQRQWRGATSADGWEWEIEVADSLVQNEVENFIGLGLEEPVRKVAHLYWMGGYSQQEIAKRLNLSQPTVSEHLRKVKEVVRRRWLGA